MGVGDVTRREFVGTTAGVVAGGVALSALAQPARANGGATGTLKVGLVGCGGRGTGAALNAMLADPDVVLWAMGDAFEDRLTGSLNHLSNQMSERDKEQGGTAHADKLQVDETRRFVGFDAYQKVIDSGVDVVLLATPPAFRPQHLRAAVGAGKHVFCEKPMAVDAPGVRSVLDSGKQAKRRGLSLMSGFCWRYNNAERATIEQVAGGAIGDVRAIYTTYNAGGFPAPKPRKPDWTDTEYMLRNWHYFHTLSGDHIVEQAVHAIDWIDWVMSAPPERCTAVGGRQVRTGPEHGNIYDHFSVEYEYASGARAFHMCRHWPNSSNDNTAYIMGSRGVCDMKPWTPSHVIKGQTDWTYQGPGSNMYQKEHDELFAAIRSGEPVNDSDWMARSTLTAIMGRMAAYTGQTVTWQQALFSEESLVPESWTWGELEAPGVALPGVTKLV